MAGTNWGHKSGVLRSQVSFQTSSLLKNCWKLDEMHPVIIFFFFLGGGGGEGGGGKGENGGGDLSRTLFGDKRSSATLAEFCPHVDFYETFPITIVYKDLSCVCNMLSCSSAKFHPSTVDE